METAVLEYNQKQQLFEKGDTLFLAVSGGPDSLAILHFFASIQASWNLTLKTLTVDHQLRGKESRDDAQFVKEESERLGIPCQIGQVNVEGYKEKHQVGTQVAARELRYQFFHNCMKDCPYSKLVLGHHQDDFTESMVMQFIKGVRPNGIPVKRTFGNHELIRPFLCVSKEEIMNYLSKHSLTPRLDPSNEEDSYTRNRVRHHVIPLMVQENPNLSKSLFNLQEQLVEDSDYLDSLAEEKFHEIIEQKPGRVVFSITVFNGLPLPLQRRIFHLILNYLYKYEIMEKDYFMTFKEWIQSNQPNSEFQVNEYMMFIKAYDECVIRKGSKRELQYYETLGLNESIQLPNGWGASVSEVNEVREIGTHTLFCDINHITFPLTVRTRKNGDRIKPLGMNGHKKVKDIFIDHKIPKYLRDEWPIVETNNEVIWIPFICKSHISKDSGQNLIQITFHK
ncbi:tRNA lysidine(34) synthetase TilS [Piscibacillus sp. B03]|uniref:tRNA lysidine(34) synthetase TilS n=1 Tax=Piscibacillus sp. B03 TaxID=3457430 RepID=UPI003FCE4229